MISAVCVLNAFVAQLDRAQASDAWCQGFESLQTQVWVLYPGKFFDRIKER